MSEQDYLMEKKVELLVDMKVKKLANQLEEANKCIKQLSEEVDILKNKVQRLNLGVSKPVQQTLGEKEATGSGQPEPKKEASNSRTGDLTPDDVSVEKMFYFGNKS